MRVHSGSWIVLAAAVAFIQDTLPPPPTGLIVGQVVDASTSRPIGDVTVSLSGGLLPLGQTRQLMTDAEGNFVFHSLTKGRYTVRATSAEYTAGGPGQHRPNGPAQPIELAADDSRAGGVVVRLWKNAVIAGTVTDEAGESVIGVNVSAYRRTLVNGQPRYTPAGSGGGTTDDRGTYRISGLVPGDYVVGVLTTQTTVPVSVAEAYAQAASTPGGTLTNPTYRELSASGALMGSMSGQRVGDLLFQASSSSRSGTLATPAAADDVRLMVYPTTVYPATSTLSQGGIVTLGSGETRNSIDLQLKLVPTLRVTGALVGPDGPVRNTAVRLYSQTTEALASFVFNPETDRKSTRLNSSHVSESRMPSSA